jgi:hypothetical protein
MTAARKELIHDLQKFSVTPPSAQALMSYGTERRHKKMTRYNGVGFYLVDPTDPDYLIVGRTRAALRPT